MCGRSMAMIRQTLQGVPGLCAFALAALFLAAAPAIGHAQGRIVGQVVQSGMPSGDAVLATSIPSGTSQGWLAQFAGNPAGPPQFLAVNKQAQELYVFEQKSPLAMVEKITCTTGEREGDKLVEGDLRTPEGVYFIQQRLSAGLDYKDYGTLAHTLNYPNPVDRLKGKTGGGIWIHGRGHQITPRETKGCVALNNDAILELDKRLSRNLPVLIAHNVDWRPEDTNFAESETLVRLVEDWTRAWESRSDTFFDFFDAEKFSKSGDESFQAFKAHKANLFKNLPWLQVRSHNIHALPGPDYWVTWFEQYYRSPSLSSGGIKRLYWMKDATGNWRVVGNEWVDADQESLRGMEARYLLDSLQQVRELVDAWRDSWLKADLDRYMAFYGNAASQGGRYGKRAIQDHKLAIWTDKRPTRVEFGALDVKLHPQGLVVGFSQEYEDAKGYKDKGFKTLVMQPRGNGWEILSEDWQAM
ncbi:L,D-transpeptidase family protein [Megalodesulfovibrio gigas]|uniref:L,D-transpeptidase family protein n=1 Tax=Megalodesulfovibrio gigas TaxID=879 RepID=UPI00130EC450|nr:L,D-transpeptidase family protein [Megalodesulfovibrio gigas]